MSELVSRRQVRRIGGWCAWAAVVLLMFTMLTGYGISAFRAVGRLTFGVLDKGTAHRLHHYTDIPLLIFLFIHVAISLWLRLGSSLHRK